MPITAFSYILRSEPLFVTSAHDIFDNNGGTLTHPGSDVCINIEPGTFPDGKQQSIFFHVIYNDTYVIRDIPETNKRTLICPVIKCGPEDINPQKAVEIVLPHCLYVDEVKKGSIEVYRCGQYTSEGSLFCRDRSHWKQFFPPTKVAGKILPRLILLAIYPMLHSCYKWRSSLWIRRLRFLKDVLDESKTFPFMGPWLPFKYSSFSIPSHFESCDLKWLIYLSLGAQKWEKIPSERSCHSKVWFSVKKDSIVIKTKIFSIWSVFVCGVGGSKRKRITAFASKPNPASNLISLRCYIYSDNEDSKRVGIAVIWNDLTSVETVKERRNRFFLQTFYIFLTVWMFPLHAL